MTHQKLDKSSSAGFTLVEVMTAAVVLIMVFLSSLSAIQQCFTISAMQRDITLAGQIAQSKVEDLRLKPWSSLSVASGPFDVATFGLESDAVKLARFTGTCSVVGASLAYQLTQYFYTRHLIKSGAAYWKLNSDGVKELKIINGRKLKMIMIQIADKSRSADYAFTVIQHPDSKQHAECFFGLN